MVKGLSSPKTGPMEEPFYLNFPYSQHCNDGPQSNKGEVCPSQEEP